jgi:hypothetical protein
MKGVYAVNDRIDRQHFHRFVNRAEARAALSRLPGLQFVRSVPEQLPAFSSSIRKNGYPASTCIRPAASGCTTSSNTPSR